ncbi:MAG: glycosyltransferase [Gammaproteobacteria bacterium]|nr:glycosyltransferase [Gammaproteobacteria bacterium]
MIMQELVSSFYREMSIKLLEWLLKRAELNKGNYQAIEDRLLYVPASSLPYHISGYTTRTHEVMRALTEVGIDLHVLTRPGYPWDRSDRIQNVDVAITRVDNIQYEHTRFPSNNLPLMVFAPLATKMIVEVAVREKVKVIHAASNHTNAIPALLAARKLGIPFQYEMRGLWELTRASRTPGYENSPGFLRGLELEGFVAKHADRVFVISEQLGEFARERWDIPADRFSLLPNCVSPDRFSLSNATDVEPNTIGYAGSLISYEGLDTLIAAVSLLANRNVKVRVDIVGDGEARVQLEEQVRRLGLSNQFRFLGRVPPEQARETLSRCVMVCIPRKPFKVCEIVPPIKLVEALAMAKPVIVPDLPVFRDELGDDSNGLFFRAGDSIDLARVIELALQDRDGLAAIGVRAREYAITQRRWHDYVVNVLQANSG